MNLLLTGEPPLHWALGGLGVAAVTLLLLFLSGQRLGVSSGFEDVCSLALRVPYLARDEIRSGRPWRLPFLGGMVLGGALSAALAGGTPGWALGIFDERVGLGPLGKSAWMFAGGLLGAFGTRLAGGCTAGHGIFGNSHLERASLASTAAFLATGMATTHLVYAVWFP